MVEDRAKNTVYWVKRTQELEQRKQDSEKRKRVCWRWNEIHGTSYEQQIKLKAYFVRVIVIDLHSLNIHVQASSNK
ncbi:uncharacterized protein CCR75_005612 [Bremia lactucae]|uniref:Uncharacterized protein n=1 Tax=Bremia lactucae TaxID=4779 RepID=A0A976IIZ8_BRELC|nr:hypothetical protein CCR75_005612 [Bremia lactucae]